VSNIGVARTWHCGDRRKLLICIELEQFLVPLPTAILDVMEIEQHPSPIDPMLQELLVLSA
jgi:hypothetical protein